MFKLTHPDLPVVAEARSPAPAIVITPNAGEAFSLDPLAKLKQVSNPFSIPIVPNPPYVVTGYLYRIAKNASETIALLNARDWWQTDDFLYAIVPQRQTIVIEFDSTEFVFPVYEASSYGFSLAGLLEGATIVSLTVGGSRYTIGSSLIQTGNTLTFTPQESVRHGERMTLRATVTKSTEPYAIVHSMDFTETALREVAQIQHLAFTYQRSLTLNFQSYQFRWIPRKADLFLPMNWEFTIARSSQALEIHRSKTIGVVNFNG